MFEPLQTVAQSGLLFVEYDLDRIAGVQFGNLDGPGIWPYADLLPISDPANFVTLGEGSTPLIAVPRIAAEIGLDDLLIKFDGLNPTGTVKDRSAVTAVAAALPTTAVAAALSTIAVAAVLPLSATAVQRWLI